MGLKFVVGIDMFFRRYWGEYLDDVTAENWRQFHDEKLHNWQPSPNICFQGKWVTVNCLGTKLPCTLGWPYTEGTGLYCEYFIWCVSYTVVLTFFVMCAIFGNCVGVLVICVLLFNTFCNVCTVFLYCFVYVGGSISFRPDIQRPRQMQNALRDI